MANTNRVIAVLTEARNAGCPVRGDLEQAATKNRRYGAQLCPGQ